MRLGDPERERIFETLSQHAAQGRLELPELERRVAIVAAALTLEEAQSVLADLPALPPPRDRRGERTGGRTGGRRGHGEAERPDPGWTPTSERFREPRTQRVMRVWEDAGGGRHYVPDEP